LFNLSSWLVDILAVVLSAISITTPAGAKTRKFTGYPFCVIFRRQPFYFSSCHVVGLTPWEAL
jgi:hypothetical protein